MGIGDNVGDKTVENRNWRTDVRGRIAIHAALKLFPDTIPNDLLLLMQSLHPFNKLPRGAVIGTVEIVDCVKMNSGLRDNPFAFGRYCLILENPEPCKPFYIKGQLGLWGFKNTNALKEKADE